MGTTKEDRFDTTEASPWMRPFVPPRFLRSGHLQTIVGSVLPRTYSLPEPESQLIEVEAHPSRTQFCAVPLPLAGRRGSQPTADSDHRSWTRGLLFFAVCLGELGARLGGRLQRRPHEYAQLR